MENKQNYYVFLDIDGTLWCSYNMAELQVDDETKKLLALDSDDPLAGYEEIKLNNESVEAVNTLLESLKAKYNVELVITSRRRSNLQKCIDYLQVNGLKFDGYISCTYRGSEPRGKKILDYLNNASGNTIEISKRGFISSVMNKFKNNSFKNFVVIDDDKTIENFISKQRIISVDGVRSSLTLSQIEKYLSKNKIPLAKSEGEPNFE